VEKVDVVIVGAGQAGLSVSLELSRRGIDHVVLERERIAQTWRKRWDSFCLVTPNWAIALPEAGYDGDDPNGYMPRDEIVSFLERYAERSDSPVREGVEVTGLKTDASGFDLDTSAGALQARAVVLCTGAYQRPFRPDGAATLPGDILQMDASDYRGPTDLPPGDVLIVGSGQTGCQLAEELQDDGRRVVLSCGKAPWIPRRIEGQDIVWWAIETGFLDQTVAELPDPRARLTANLLATGHEGGHDLHYRTLQALGVELIGHFQGSDDSDVLFADDLQETVAWSDEAHDRFMALVRKLIVERGLPAIRIEEPAPFKTRAPQSLPLADFAAVIFTGGFRPDYRAIAPWPEAFDEIGFPVQTDGASEVVDGLFFAGVHFMRKRKSSILWGVGEDAGVVASGIATHLGAASA
jgi:putative flavoprotein involved in K+ transport